jgi:hypothetical protein
MQYHQMMRTTIHIDDDVLTAAKELARAQKSTAGQVISDLARQALSGPRHETTDYRNGVPQLPRANRPITSEMVKKWLEEDV